MFSQQALEYAKSQGKGSTTPDGYTILWENYPFIIMKFCGGSYWSGMQGKCYCPVDYSLIDISNPCIQVGRLTGKLIYKEEKGRWSNKRLKVFKQKVGQ